MNNLIKKWFYRIDIIKQIENPFIVLVKQDLFSNIFVVNLLNNGNLVTLKDTTMVTLNIEKPDRTKVVISGKVVDGGMVEFLMDFQSIANIGICTATVRIVSGDNIVTSLPFSYKVIDDPYAGTDGSVESESKFPVLLDLITRTESLINRTNEAMKFYEDNLSDFKKLSDNSKVLLDLAKNKDEAKELIKQSSELRGTLELIYNRLGSIDETKVEIENLLVKIKEIEMLLSEYKEEIERLLLEANEGINTLSNLLDRFDLIHANMGEIEAKNEDITGLISSLETNINSADSINSELLKTIKSANTSNEDLKEVRQEAVNTDTVLKQNIESAKSVDGLLKTKIETGNILDSTLKQDIDNAKTIDTTLKDTTVKAKNSNTELASTNETAKGTNVDLKATNEIAKETEGILNEIISSGDLGSYAKKTDLEPFATLEELEAIDVSEQLTEYEKTVDVDKKIATINTEVGNKANADEVETALKDKVSKKAGYDLSKNDYTDAEKEKLTEIETGAEKNLVTSVQGRTGAVVITKEDIEKLGIGGTDENLINEFATKLGSDYIYNRQTDLYKYMNRYLGTSLTSAIQNVNDLANSATAMNAVANSATAMNAVANSATAMNAVANSATAMNAVANSATAMNAVANSATAMNAVANSATAMNAVANSATAMNAVANSATAMNAVINSATAMNAVANSATAMNAVANSATAMNAVANSATAMNAVANSATAMNAVEGKSITVKNSTDNEYWDNPYIYSKKALVLYAYRETIATASTSLIISINGKSISADKVSKIKYNILKNEPDIRVVDSLNIKMYFTNSYVIYYPLGG